MTALLTKVIDVIEFEVPTTSGEPLFFRLEVLKTTNGGQLRYKARLYRLESFRFRYRDAAPVRRWSEADYRCWVVDDNLGAEDKSYGSLAATRRGVLNQLFSQLGSIDRTRNKKKRKS